MKSLFFCFILAFSTQLAFSQTEPLDTDGDGYRNVSTLDHLLWIAKTWPSHMYHYEMDNDIDCSETRFWNVGDHDNNPETPDSAMGWEPMFQGQIYHFEYSFCGQFEGHGHKISNLYINRPVNQYPVGLFSCLEEAQIRNVSMINVDITGHTFVGALVGFLGNYHFLYGPKRINC